MNDAELYKFFKERSQVFNEMPPDELWGKISTALHNPAQKAASKSFLSKLFLMIAFTIGLALGIIVLGHSLEENNNAEKKPIPPKSDSTGGTITKDTVLKDIPLKNPVGINRLQEKTTLKIPAVRAYTLPAPKTDSIIKTMRSINPKSGLPLKPIDFNTNQAGSTARLPDTHIINTTSRIVITSTKRLTDVEFEALIDQSLEINKGGAIGKMIIVKAPGHKPFKKYMITAKTDTITPILLKIPILPAIFDIKDSLK